MGRQRYEINAEDYAAAEGWIGRHLPELPHEVAQAFRGASSPAELQSIVDRFFNPAQRRRLHGAIRQTRNRIRQRSICVTLKGKTADHLYQISEWTGQTPAYILWVLISGRRHDLFYSYMKRIRLETGKTMSFEEEMAKGPELISAWLLKAGQKLDK